MMKKALLKKHSRHVALLTAIVLAFSNVGSCMTVSFADEITSESGSGSEGGNSSGSEGSSSSGSESGGSSSGSESGGSSSGSGSESGDSSGSGSESGDSSGSGSESGGSSGSGTEGEGETGSGTEGEGETGSGTEGEGETGSGTEGEGETGSGTEGEGETGSGDEGEGETGSGTEGEGEGETGSGTEGGEEAGNEDESTAGGAAGGAGAANGPEVEKEKEFTVTYTVNPENAAVVEGESEVTEGEELVFTVEPQDGYVIQNVTANGYEVLAEADDAEENDTVIVTYVVSGVDDDLDIEVEMAEDESVKSNNLSELEAIVDDITITVTYEEGVLPKNCELEVNTLNEEQVEKVKILLVENIDMISEEVLLYDIKIKDEFGNEIQPEDGAVKISFSNILLEESIAETVCEVYHIDDALENIQSMDANIYDNIVEIDTDHFSIYAVTFVKGEISGTLKIVQSKINEQVADTIPIEVVYNFPLSEDFIDIKSIEELLADFGGYEFVKATVGSNLKSEKVSAFRMQGNVIQYSFGEDWYDITDETIIYFWYGYGPYTPHLNSKYTVSGEHREMSSYVNVFEDSDGTRTLVYEIGNDAEGDIVINLKDFLATAQNFMPGDTTNATSLKIVNKSGHHYKYKENSFTFTPSVPEDLIQECKWASYTGVYGFAGDEIVTAGAAAVTDNHAIKDLCGKTEITLSDLLNIYDYLEEQGYPGGREANALTHYYLDYYNKKYNTQAECMEDLDFKAIVDIWGNTINDKGDFVGVAKYKFSSSYGSGSEVTYKCDAAKLSELEDMGYAYNTKVSSKKLTAVLKYMEPELIQLGYNYFYTTAIAMSLDYKANPLNRKSLPEWSMYSYMNPEMNAYTVANEMFGKFDLTAYDSTKEPSSNKVEDIIAYVDAYNLPNAYAGYSMGWDGFIVLEQMDVSTPPAPPTPPTPPDGGSSGGGGGGGSTPGGHRATPETNGPGITIEPEAVPLAPLPEITIPENEVPLAPLPKTGDSVMSQWICLMSGLLLGMYGLFGRKKEDF